MHLQLIEKILKVLLDKVDGLVAKNIFCLVNSSFKNPFKNSIEYLLNISCNDCCDTQILFYVANVDDIFGRDSLQIKSP